MKKLKLHELNRKSVSEFKKALKIPVVVVLDNIRSMHNVGSVFRTCDAFLVEKLFLCGISPIPPHREISKTAIGATESVDWEYFNNTFDALNYLKHLGYFLIAVEQTTESVDLDLYLIKNHVKYALIFGNEVNGISDECMHIIDQSIEIAQAGTKHSLNVSVAGGIVLHKFFNFFIKQKPFSTAKRLY